MELNATSVDVRLPATLSQASLAVLAADLTHAFASPVPVARHAGQGRGRPALSFCASRGPGAVLAASGATAVSTVVPGCSSEPPDTKLHVGQRPVVRS